MQFADVFFPKFHLHRKFFLLSPDIFLPESFSGKLRLVLTIMLHSCTQIQNNERHLICFPPHTPMFIWLFLCSFMACHNKKISRDYCLKIYCSIPIITLNSLKYNIRTDSSIRPCRSQRLIFSFSQQTLPFQSEFGGSKATSYKISEKYIFVLLLHLLLLNFFFFLVFFPPTISEELRCKKRGIKRIVTWLLLYGENII